MLTLRTDGMLYHKNTHTLLGVWPISTNSLKEAPPTLTIVGRRAELTFKLMAGVQDVCAVYEYRNSLEYYMLKLYWSRTWSRTAMLDWWYEAQRR